MKESKGSPLLPAIVGGIIGAALTLAILVLAAPQLVSSRIVRQAC